MSCLGIRVILLQPNGTFLWDVVHYNFCQLFCIQYQYFISTCGAWAEVVFEFEQRAIYFSSLRAKLILGPFGMPNEFDPQ